MSQAGPLPFLDVSGVEVANAARTYGYLRLGLGETNNSHWELSGEDVCCGVLYRLNGGTSGHPTTFLSPAADPAPWYDPTEPGSTTFLGLILLDLKGYDSTITRSVTPRLTGLGGGYFGGQHRTPRTWTFRAAMISSDDAGAEYGLRWLTSALQARCDGCASGSLTVRIACPPETGLADTLGEWVSYEAALTEGPHEVEQFTDRPADSDNMAGCRDVVIVEWTMQSANPWLYKPAVAVATADITTLDFCSILPDINSVSGGLITDDSREADVDGDGADPSGSYGIWQATINQVTNGGAELSATGWSAEVGGSLARTTSEQKFGSYAIRYQSANVAASEGLKAQTATGVGAAAGTVCQASVWLKGVAGGEQLEVLGRIANTDASTTTGTPQPIVLSRAWQRFTVSVTVAGGKLADQIFVVARAPSGITLGYAMYADGAQVETAKPYPTPYVDTTNGVLGRLAGEVHLTGSVLDRTQGWVALRVRPGFDSAASAGNGAFEWFTGGNGFKLGYAAGNWTLTSSGGGGSSVSVADTFAAGDARTLVAAWTATHLLLSLDGAVFVSVAATPPGVFATVIDVGSSTAAGTFIDGDVFWLAGGVGTLTDADAADIAAFQDQATLGTLNYVFRALAAPGVTVVWNGSSRTGICEFLNGDPSQVLCLPVTTPLRGAIAPVFTLTSDAGYGAVVFQAWDSCGDTTGPAPLELEIGAVPAGSTVVVNCATRTVTVTSGGVAVDGQYLLQLPDGRGQEWIQSEDCNQYGCFCVATPVCGVGSFTVAVETQTREG